MINYGRMPWLIEREQKVMISPGTVEAVEWVPAVEVDTEALAELFSRTLPNAPYPHMTCPFELTINVGDNRSGLLLPFRDRAAGWPPKYSRPPKYRGASIILARDPTLESDRPEDLMRTVPRQLWPSFEFYHEWKHLMDLLTYSTYVSKEEECDRFALDEVERVMRGEAKPVVILEDGRE